VGLDHLDGRGVAGRGCKREIDIGERVRRWIERRDMGSERVAIRGEAGMRVERSR